MKKLFTILIISILFVGLVGNVYADHTVLHKFIEALGSTSTVTTTSTANCNDNLDCELGRVCVNGGCVVVETVEETDIAETSYTPQKASGSIFLTWNKDKTYTARLFKCGKKCDLNGVCDRDCSKLTFVTSGVTPIQKLDADLGKYKVYYYNANKFVTSKQIEVFTNQETAWDYDFNTNLFREIPQEPVTEVTESTEKVKFTLYHNSVKNLLAVTSSSQSKFYISLLGVTSIGGEKANVEVKGPDGSIKRIRIEQGGSSFLTFGSIKLNLKLVTAFNQEGVVNDNAVLIAYVDGANAYNMIFGPNDFVSFVSDDSYEIKLMSVTSTNHIVDVQISGPTGVQREIINKGKAVTFRNTGPKAIKVHLDDIIDHTDTESEIYPPKTEFDRASLVFSVDLSSGDSGSSGGGGGSSNAVCSYNELSTGILLMVGSGYGPSIEFDDNDESYRINLESVGTSVTEVKRALIRVTGPSGSQVQAMKEGEDYIFNEMGGLKEIEIKVSTLHDGDGTASDNAYIYYSFV